MAAVRLLPALVLAGLLSAPGLARAEVTADQAKTLESQLRDWLGGLVKPVVDVGERPVQVAPEGDHFRVLLPAPAILSTVGVLEPGLQLSLTARPMDGGRWALEDLRLPSPMRMTMKSDKASKTVNMTTETTLGSQEFHAVFDPSLATTSSFDSSVTNVRSVGTPLTPSDEIGVSTSTVAKATGHSIWQPAGDGHINMLSESTLSQITTQTALPNGGQVTSQIAKGQMSLNVKNFAPGSLGALIRSISAFVPTMQDKQDRLTPEQRELARTMVFSLRDMMGGAEIGESLEGLTFTAAGHSGSLRKLTGGMTMGAPEGKLSLGTEFAFEGIDSPEIPKGLFRDYLPRRVAFKPRVSGIPAEDVIKLALRAIDTDAKDMASLQGDAFGLLAAGPLEVALDDVVLDLGAASLAANGSVQVSSPTDISGDGTITVKGLSALIRRANTAPELKDMAPVLIFLKGIGKQDGDETTWELSYDNGTFTVNDTDMSALMPGGAQKSK